MDPFTQRMLERARARREKLDSKLVSNGQEVSQRAPLAENKLIMPESKNKLIMPESKKIENKVSPIKATTPTNKKTYSPAKKVVYLDKAVVTPNQEIAKVTTDSCNSKEIIKRVSSGRNEGRTSVEINIKHGDDIHVEVQVEEREVPMSVYLEEKKKMYCKGQEGTTTFTMIETISNSDRGSDKENSTHDSNNSKAGLRQIAKSRLQRLGVLYSGYLQFGFKKKGEMVIV